MRTLVLGEASSMAHLGRGVPVSYDRPGSLPLDLRRQPDVNSNGGLRKVIYGQHAIQFGGFAREHVIPEDSRSGVRADDT